MCCEIVPKRGRASFTRSDDEDVWYANDLVVKESPAATKLHS